MAGKGLANKKLALCALRTLRAYRAYEKRHLHFVRTREDHDLVVEIGYHQLTQQPLTPKQALRLGISSAATVQRRLRRLRHVGAIAQRRADHDRRAVELSLTSRVVSIFAGYARLARRRA